MVVGGVHFEVTCVKCFTQTIYRCSSKGVLLVSLVEYTSIYLYIYICTQNTNTLSTPVLCRGCSVWWVDLGHCVLYVSVSCCWFSGLCVTLSSVVLILQTDLLSLASNCQFVYCVLCYKCTLVAPFRCCCFRDGCYTWDDRLGLDEQLSMIYVSATVRWRCGCSCSTLFYD